MIVKVNSKVSAKETKRLQSLEAEKQARESAAQNLVSEYRRCVAQAELFEKRAAALKMEVVKLMESQMTDREIRFGDAHLWKQNAANVTTTGVTPEVTNHILKNIPIALKISIDWNRILKTPELKKRVEDLGVTLEKAVEYRLK